jgi:hypothetical protein
MAKKATASFHALVSRIEHLSSIEARLARRRPPYGRVHNWRAEFHESVIGLSYEILNFYGLTNDPSICRTFIQPGSVGGYGIGYFLAISSSRSIPSPGLSLP